MKEIDQKPIAKLVPYEQSDEEPRRPGYWRGNVEIAEDFDELPEEIAAAFRGKSKVLDKHCEPDKNDK